MKRSPVQVRVFLRKAVESDADARSVRRNFMWLLGGMVDALVSGISVHKGVRVRVPWGLRSGRLGGWKEASGFTYLRFWSKSSKQQSRRTGCWDLDPSPQQEASISALCAVRDSSALDS